MGTLTKLIISNRQLLEKEARKKLDYFKQQFQESFYTIHEKYIKGNFFKLGRYENENIDLIVKYKKRVNEKNKTTEFYFRIYQYTSDRPITEYGDNDLWQDFLIGHYNYEVLNDMKNIWRNRDDVINEVYNYLSKQIKGKNE